MDGVVGPRLDLGEGLSLVFRVPCNSGGVYPTDRIQKGLVLCCGETELVEEGIGFGAPLALFGNETIFPGEGRVSRAARRADGAPVVRVEYDMGLVERMTAWGKPVRSTAFYGARDRLASLHRRCPPLRGLGTFGSSGLRALWQLGTVFVQAGSCGVVTVEYAVEEERMVHVRADLGGLKREGCTGIVLANEQGASYFDSSWGSSRAALRRAIGAWEETFDEVVSFVDPRRKVAFALQRVEGARMFRGRERVGRRLAWSGINYLLPADTLHFSYAIEVGRPDDLCSADIPVLQTAS